MEPAGPSLYGAACTGFHNLENAVLDTGEILADEGVFNITFRHTVPGPALVVSVGKTSRRLQYHLAGIELIAEC